MGRIKHKNNTLRETLGISQEEMAQLFKIHPSQIAMYETGKRELPVAAQLTLTQLYIHIKEKEKETFVHPNFELETEKIISFLEDEIQKKKLQQRNCSQKLIAMKKNYEKGMSNWFMADYFELDIISPISDAKSTADYLRILAKEKLDKNGPLAQLNYQIKWESLESELNYLHDQLKKYK